MKYSRAKTACDGLQDCFNCPYPECRVSGTNALRGNIGRDIEEALGEEKPSKARQRERAHKRYEQYRLDKLEYQKRLRAANRIKYAAKQAVIREARLAKGWRQSDLAEAIGVSQHTISCWEHGTAPADWSKIYRVFPKLKQEGTT